MINLTSAHLVRKVLVWSTSLALLFAVPATFALIPVSAVAATTHNWQVQAGASGGGGKIATMKYYPGQITIDQGDSITWMVKGDAHTISFLSGATPPEPGSPESLAPSGGSTYDGTGIVSSGLIDPMHTYTLTFTKPGMYTYNCLIHPGMQGTVVVQPSGTGYPQTQAQYDRQSRWQEFNDIITGYQMIARNRMSSPIQNSDGTQTYQAQAGMGQNMIGIMRFTPQTLFIHANDSVTWTNDDAMDPHTVTFPGADGRYPSSDDISVIMNPVGGSTYDGSTLTSSGFIYPPGAPGNHTYTLKFTKPGRYNYECLLHDEMGMKGTIIVLP